MHKVKILAGGYGLRKGTRNTLCTKNNIVEVDDAEAERIVSLGVAEYFDSVVATPPADEFEENSGDNTPNGENGSNDAENGDSETPAYSVDMKADELRAIGKQFDITFKVGTTKEDMVKALDEYFADGEDAPELTAGAPV